MNIKTKKIIFLILLALSLRFVQAGQQKIVLYQISDQHQKFIYDQERNITISKDCMNKNSTCEAWQQLKKINSEFISKIEIPNGVNLGVVLCEKLPNAQVIYALSLKSNSVTLCQFNDQSMITTASLSSYANTDFKGYP